MESKVFGFLGQVTGAKESFVKKLDSAIDSEDPSISSLRNLSENECRETHSQSIFETRARLLNCFDCEGCPEGVPIPNCQCCYSMTLDTGLLCAGAVGDQEQMFDEFSRFIEENVLAYSLAIKSWLQDAPPKPVTSLIATRYVADDNALELTARVHSFLGEKDEAKEWLTACLLKTIKDNQRWHKRTELIDDFLEATSWFRGKHGVRP